MENIGKRMKWYDNDMIGADQTNHLIPPVREQCALPYLNDIARRDIVGRKTIVKAPQVP